MKVLLLNGSSRQNGNTYIALLEIAKTLEQEGICLLYTSPSPRD